MSEGAIPNSLIPVLVTGIQYAQVLGRKGSLPGRKSFAAQTRLGWIPVTSTGMREDKWAPISGLEGEAGCAAIG
jgi:hypothetical protein